jgi:hypothetical protein
MQGVWENTLSLEDEKAYLIVNGKTSLNIVFNPKLNTLDFPLNESIKGFQNLDGGEGDSINVSWIEADGRFYTTVDVKYVNQKGWVKRPHYLTPSFFECDGAVMSINGGGRLVEYVKSDVLPYTMLALLYEREKKDKKHYIKNYLSLNTKKVIGSKVIVYSGPDADQPTNHRLHFGSIVVIYKISQSMYQVDFHDANRWLRGWVKMNALAD